jgi:hypothetical protein
MTHRKPVVSRQAEWQRRRIAEGLCGNCGLRPILAGSKYRCAECLDKHRESSPRSGKGRPRIPRGIAAALLSLFTLAGLAKAQEDSPMATPNLVGSMLLTLVPIEANGQIWLEVRTSGGANRPSTTNGFNADSVILSHCHFRLTVDETRSLVEGIRTWDVQQHSDTVFRVPGHETGIGISFTGNAWSETLDPVVILNIQIWIQQERGHIHGGNYIVLSREQAGEIANVLEKWADNPEAGEAIFAASVQ